jgi:putative ABC transport system substrate-binding protein
MTSRRAALRLSATALLSVASRGTLSQRQPAIPRVGALLFASSSDPLAQKYMAVFRQRLRELGYIEGRTIIIDERFAAGSAQRLVELARELADARPDVLITPAVAATVAMRQATDTIPIVMLHAAIRPMPVRGRSLRT